MIKRRRFPRIFPGWWIVLTSGILALWGDGFSFYGFSAFFKPIASELGFSRAVTSVAASVRRLEGGLESPLVGWLTDRFGPKWLVLSGVFIMGLALTLMYFVNSLWAYLVVWGVILGTGNNIALSLPLDTTIANWFVKKRGLALGTKILINGFAGAVVPLVAWLITTQGWRMAAVIGGVVMWLVGLPLVWFFVKQHRPEYYGLLPDGATTEEEPDKGQSDKPNDRPRSGICCRGWRGRVHPEADNENARLLDANSYTYCRWLSNASDEHPRYTFSDR
ncbi:hypothetical protein ES703_22728 [subsurface metagenome]